MAALDNAHRIDPRPKKKVELNDADKHTSAYVQIMDYLDHRLGTLRLKNDNTSGKDKTEHLRGAIKEIKSLQKMLRDEKPKLLKPLRVPSKDDPLGTS